MSFWSDYLENKLVDAVFRGQAFPTFTNLYVALYTGAPSDAGGGTEVSTSSTGYARVQVASSLANWAGTQGAGTTVASSGTSGTTSNNGAITFPTPIANWGTVTHMGVFDAPTGGNLVGEVALAAPKTINNGDPAPSFGAGALSVQVDN